jgi:predicted aspartyl protease
VFWLLPAVFASSNLLADVPFDLYRGEVVAQVRICGKGPFTVLLDTGTAPSIIDLTLTKQLGIKVQGSGESGSGGGTGKAKAYRADLPQLDLGGFVEKNVNCYAMDLSDLSGRFGRHLDGVLGDSVFDGRVVQFDYPGKVARFYRRDPTLTGVRLSFAHLDDEVHLKGIRVNGEQIVANLDTGANSSFQVTPRGIHKLRLNPSSPDAKVIQSGGFNGGYQSRSGKLSSVDLGPYHVSNPEATLWLPGAGHDDREFDMNIGNGFWQDYVLTIDYRKHVVTLSKS